MDFDRLRAERQTLNNAVLRHGVSIAGFRAGDWPWFRLTIGEDIREKDKGKVRHLSTSASCIESLTDIPESQAAHQEAAATWRAIVNPFAEMALKRDDWESDRAAWVYCRARTLPIILDWADAGTLKPFGEQICDHVRFVWNQLDPERPDAQGIAEKSTKDDGGDEKRDGEEDERDGKDQHYPPNAFHTYWALRLLSSYRGRMSELALPELDEDIELKRAVALLWSSRTLSAQTALIRGKAERCDAQQLAWALLADFEGGLIAGDGPVEQPVTTADARRELYASALGAFFSEQDEESGGWPLYDPLFHYPHAGNAYCYTFETLAHLLRPALRRSEGRLLRDLLHPHLPELIKARELAERTAIELPGGAVGWSSGHHPHRRQAEAWATASVFSYLQALRRLVGYWTAHAAQRALGVRKPKYADRQTAEESLRARGRTWTDAAHPLNVGRELAGLFAHPQLSQPRDRTMVDPDEPLIAKDHARSAILFGPPGTGKTTLVEALAGMIGWDFLEIPASEFVSSGMDKVPARAELIFTQLMELDRVVVLFDEVDELIRQREGDRSDPFGRFLTTSMLPKLTKLWEQRRVLFFVATNSIDNADPAIRRSQRFDAAIFTAPPSFQEKQTRLREFLGADPPPELTKETIEEELTHALGDKSQGTYALLRWDQIPELARRARDASSDGVPNLVDVTTVLGKMGTELSDLEYHTEKDHNIFEVWRTYWRNARRDYGRALVVRLDRPPDVVPNEWDVVGVCPDTGAVYVDLSNAVKQLNCGEDDTCTLTAGDHKFSDKGVLDFESE